jgi:hypothetical protein
MSRRNLFASILTACLIAIGSVGFASVADAARAGKSWVKHGKSAGHHVTEIRRRGRALRFYTPIAPSYIYYDYPYYYSRGYYPTHIGPGFLYYGYPYSYYRHGFGSRYGD